MSQILALARDVVAESRRTLREQDRQARDQDAALEEAEQLTSRLGRFIRGCWHVLEPGTAFHSGWHIDAICEMVEAAYRREIRRLLISVPPRHMKSLTTCVAAPAWRWTIEPSERFITSSYAEDLATRDAVKSRDLIRSGWFQMRFGDRVRLKADMNRQDRYENDATGMRLAVSYAGSATGEGGNVLVFDDPNNAKDATSPAALEKARQLWGGVWATRLNDPASGVKIVVGQRIHEADLIGHIIETEGLVRDGGVWEYLCLPGEYEPQHPFVWPDDPRVQAGELLWPGHIDAAALGEITGSMTQAQKAGQIQQRPAAAEGTLLKRKHWRYYRQLPALSMLVHSWDTTFKDKASSDWCVGTLWGVDQANRFLIRRVRERLALDDAKKELAGMVAWAEQEFGPAIPQFVLVENAANGPEIVAQMRRHVPGLIAVTASRWGDKTQRANATLPYLEAGNVWLPGAALDDGSDYDPMLTPAWAQSFVDECAGFPLGSFDDQVDSFSQAIIWLRDRGVPVPKAGSPAEADRAHTAGIADAQF